LPNSTIYIEFLLNHAERRSFPIKIFISLFFVMSVSAGTFHLSDHPMQAKKVFDEMEGDEISKVHTEEENLFNIASEIIYKNERLIDKGQIFELEASTIKKVKKSIRCQREKLLLIGELRYLRNPRVKSKKLNTPQFNEVIFKRPSGTSKKVKELNRRGFTFDRWIVNSGESSISLSFGFNNVASIYVRTSCKLILD